MISWNYSYDIKFNFIVYEPEYPLQFLILYLAYSRPLLFIIEMYEIDK